MSATATLLSLLCLGIAPCGEDQPSVVKTGNRTVDFLIADIAERRRGQAIDRISGVSSVTGRNQIVRTPAQFVDRLLGCTTIQSSAKTLGKYYFRVEWLCGGKRYFADFDTLHTRPYVEVMLEDESTAKMPAVAPAPPLPGPDRHVPPAKEFIDTIARSLMVDEHRRLLAWMKSDTIVSLARRDNSNNVDVYEREDLGPAAISPIVEASFKRVGKPVSFECAQERYGGTCKFLFDKPGVALTCWIGAYSGRINAIRFTWQTHKQDLLDRAKNWGDD